MSKKSRERALAEGALRDNCEHSAADGQPPASPKTHHQINSDWLP